MKPTEILLGGRYDGLLVYLSTEAVIYLKDAETQRNHVYHRLATDGRLHFFRSEKVGPVDSCGYRTST